ncbi:Gfo/Idh/MocA family protein [Rubellimicrobium roseum]|uniref:Gfo/Idh/MocA family oxidoreductase n=1 Tax=Rubellimicrobium roseum TaxID=687525 RepID=A0A5C4NDF4_9RHOB|nr:Gfo/Idh/MocA family oxidoreductase [Rubellimicrobium roseum]TNC66619.1 Gfo/Idh/MocA family oxidoreductase [Rubellimicrobium roseum]
MLRAVMAGCGAMSNGWLRAIRETPALAAEVEVVGLVDLDESVARARGAEHGLDVPVGADLGAMIDMVRPDAVFDLVVPPARAGVVELALARGCHVLSEKPLATSMEEARRLLAAAERAGRIHGVVQNRRHLPGIRRVRALLASGALGELTAIHSDFFIGAHFGGFREEMDHVLLLDMAIHTFDQARFLSGLDAARVYCRETNPQGSWYRHGAAAEALFDMERGVAFTYRGSWVAEGANTAWEASWRIVGTRGTVLWDGNEGIEAHRVAGGEGFFRPLEEVPVPETDLPAEGHAGVILDFARALREGRRPLTDARDNIRSLAMVFGAIRSAEAGAPMPVEGTDLERTTA